METILCFIRVVFVVVFFLTWSFYLVCPNFDAALLLVVLFWVAPWSVKSVVVPPSRSLA